MARNTIKIRKHETGRSITTKTPYGTTSDMLVKDEEVYSKQSGFTILSTILIPSFQSALLYTILILSFHFAHKLLIQRYNICIVPLFFFL